MTEMTDEERAAVTVLLADLHEAGYRNIAEWRELKPGMRIRRRSQEYPEAYEHGTGVVVAITEKPDSAWSKTYGAADIEMVILSDRSDFGSRLTTLAQYHVAVIGDGS